MNSGGPYVSVAALCELVLEEKVERLSCIRFMDKIEVTSTFSRPVSDQEKELLPTAMPVVPFPVRGLLSLKSGGFIGKKVIRIDLIPPSGKPIKKEGATQSFPAFFEGGEHGVNLVLDFTLNTQEEGLYYFDVFLDDEVITRIPLRVTFTRHIPSDLPPPGNSMTVESAEPQT